MRRMRSHLTYANVMVTLLAFGALTGGVAYAANTIGSSDIINGEVRSVDIGNNQVQSVDVRDDTLSGGGLSAEDLRPGSVANDEIRAGAIPDHLEDPIIVSSGSNTTTAKEVLVPCEFGGDNVTGGGFVISGPGGIERPERGDPAKLRGGRSHLARPGGGDLWRPRVAADRDRDLRLLS